MSALIEPFVCAYKGHLLAGVDEVGRGPLADDVVAAAVILDPQQPIVGLADSKKLTEKKRLALADEIRARHWPGVWRGPMWRKSTVSIFSMPPCWPCSGRWRACPWRRNMCWWTAIASPSSRFLARLWSKAMGGLPASVRRPFWRRWCATRKWWSWMPCIQVMAWRFTKAIPRANIWRQSNGWG